MSSALSVIFTKNFEDAINNIPERDRKRILYDLTHTNRQDILRQGHLQGELNYLRKMNNGDYRIFMAYCSECYKEFRHKINCIICDKNNLNRLVVFFIAPRKKLYRPHKFQKVDITKIKF